MWPAGLHLVIFLLSPSRQQVLSPSTPNCWSCPFVQRSLPKITSQKDARFSHALHCPSSSSSLFLIRKSGHLPICATRGKIQWLCLHSRGSGSPGKLPGPSISFSLPTLKWLNLVESNSAPASVESCYITPFFSPISSSMGGNYFS